MIILHPDEKIVLSFHRHWTVFMGKILLLALLIILAPLILLAASKFENQEMAAPLALFLTSIYLLIALFAAFAFWLNYYFDIWIITTERIIDVEQKSLFSREISEFSLLRVQDVTVEISGFLPTLFKFGNLTVQTAGERNFTAKEIAGIHRVKNTILKQAQLIQKVGAEMEKYEKNEKRPLERPPQNISENA